MLPFKLKFITEKKLTSAFMHITLTRATAVFFIFSVLHCFAQGILQAFLYTIDSGHDALVSVVLQASQVPPGELAWFTRHQYGYKVQLCHDVPLNHSAPPCQVIFESGRVDISVAPGYRRAADGQSARIPRSSVDQTTLVVPSFDISGNLNGVNIQLDADQVPLHLSLQCTRVLLYADQVLKNSKREDFALISVQFWLFAISYIAIIYDSIPHTLAVFCARVLVTGWSAYTIWRTLSFEDQFRQMIIDPGSPCQVNLFPMYFMNRMGLEIADLVLNCTALFLSAYLSWRLLRTYQTISFKHLGAPVKVLRIYKYFMAVLVCLQLSVFLLVTAMALWINQLIYSPVARISYHTPIYIALFISTTVLLIPWIIMGWYAIRRELTKLMAAFLVLGFVFISGWLLMFYSMVYRWTFLDWPFLACITLASLIVMTASLALGVKAWLNFNQGLSNYLYAEDRLSITTLLPEVFPHDIETPEIKEPKEV